MIACVWALANNFSCHENDTMSEYDVTKCHMCVCLTPALENLYTVPFVCSCRSAKGNIFHSIVHMFISHNKLFCTLTECVEQMYELNRNSWRLNEIGAVSLLTDSKLSNFILSYSYAAQSLIAEPNQTIVPSYSIQTLSPYKRKKTWVVVLTMSSKEIDVVCQCDIALLSSVIAPLEIHSTSNAYLIKQVS